MAERITRGKRYFYGLGQSQRALGMPSRLNAEARARWPLWARNAWAWGFYLSLPASQK